MSKLKLNICGAPSSYKTTVCTGLESKLKQARYNAETSKEYARHYISTYGVPVDLHEQLTIYENQNSRDIAVAETNTIMLSDTPAMSSYVFGKRMLDAKIAREDRGKHEKPRLPNRAEYKFLEELYMKALKKTNWFNMIIVFPPTGDIVQDGVRNETVDDQMEIYRAVTGFLHLNNIRYTEVSGSTEERIDTCFALVMTAIGGNGHGVYEIGSSQPIGWMPRHPYDGIDGEGKRTHT
jgi:nicotinamide riboside kinase